MKECIGKKIVGIKTSEEYENQHYFNLLLDDGSVIFVNAVWDCEKNRTYQEARIIEGEDARLLSSSFNLD